MDTGEFVRLIGALAVGALLTAFGSGLNHVFSTRVSERARRASEVAYWFDFIDDYYRVHVRMAELTGLTTASELPDDLGELVRVRTDQIQTLKAAVEELDAGTRRAPEPLTGHVRLFLERMSRAYSDDPVSYEAVNRAVMVFRQALHDYERSGRVAPPKPLPDESWPKGTY